MKCRHYRERLVVVFIVCLSCIILSFLVTPLIINVITIQVSSTVNHFNCSNLTMVKTIDNTDCVSEPYSGDLCLQLLETTQSCSVSTRNSVLVNTSDRQQLLETNLATFLSILERNGSQQCRDAMLPFMCQYTFPLCDSNTKQLYLPTQERCIEISGQVCSREWNLTRQLGYQNLLPNCTTLRRQTSPNITCRDGFISLNGTCQARCDQNIFQLTASIVANRVLRFAGTIATVIGGGIFLTASVVRYKEMFSFPLIILVYMTTEVLIMGIAFLVTESGFPGLLCSSVTLAESILNPTILCLVSGAIFHYSIVGMYLFWFFHVSYFFYKVMFPFHANAHQSYKKYIHLTMATFGFLAPLPAVIAALAVDNNQYSIGLFFIPVCISKNLNLITFSTSFVITILLIISTILLIIIIGKIFKSERIKSEKAILLSTAERKLLFVLSLSIATGIFVFVFILSSRITAKTQNSLALEYFECESDGYVPGKCNKAALQQDPRAWFISSQYMLLAATPLINLLFVIKFKKMKEKIKIVMHRLSHCINWEQHEYPLEGSTTKLDV